jgi:hypothetical protein
MKCASWCRLAAARCRPGPRPGRRQRQSLAGAMATGPWRDLPPLRLPAADVAVRTAGTATQLGSWPGVLGRNWQCSVMLSAGSWGSESTRSRLRPGLYESWFRKNGVKNRAFFATRQKCQNCGSLRNLVWMQKGHFATGPKRDPNARSVRRKLLERHAFVILTSACVSTQAVSRIASICAPPL